MKAIIKKDLLMLVKNRRLFSTLLIVPLVLTVLLPSVMLLAVFLAPEEAADFGPLLDLLPASLKEAGLQAMIVTAVIDYVLPVFFLLIPVMASSVMAASSFTGEKEKRTLETLLYCPLTLRQIFRAKVLASFIISMLVSLLSFLLMLTAVELETFFLAGSLLIPGVSWLLVMLLLAPAISLIAITLIVRVSAKSQSMEEAQQKAVFLILPLILLIVAQFTGLVLLDPLLLLILGALLALLAFVLLKRALGRLSYEAPALAQNPLKKCLHSTATCSIICSLSPRCIKKQLR